MRWRISNVRKVNQKTEKWRDKIQCRRNCIEKYDIYVGGKRQSKRSLFLFGVYWNSILK